MRGEVRLRVRGLLPERLLQRALERGATFARVARPDPRTLLVETSPSGARVLLELCARFSIPAQVLERRGGSAALAFLRRRITLLAGLVVCAALCALFFDRVWRVDVAFTGEEAARGDPAPFLEALESLGVRPGVSRALDTALLAQALSAGAEGYSFVGVRLQGVRLLVEAAPEVPAPDVYDVDAARDLYAARDGIVVSASARSGSLCVKPGDTVRRGQLVIRGEERVSGEGTRRIGALGEVIVRAWYAGAATAALSETSAAYTGRASASSRLALPWLELPIAEGERYDAQVVETERLPIGGLFVPVEIVRDTAREVREVRTPRDRARLEERLAALALADAARRLALEGPEDCEIARRWVRFETEGDALTASAVYEIITDAAVTREVLWNTH